MRLFIAVWPAAEVVDVLRGLPRPEHPSLRWTRPEQWHVTLRFVGQVDEADLTALTDAVRAVADRHTARRAELGPATARLGRGVLVVPVSGIDDLGVAVVDATRSFGAPPDERPFTAHVTLARGRGRRPVPAALAGTDVVATWEVDELAVVRSHPTTSGSRYESLASLRLSPG